MLSNADFSETALSICLIFGMKLGGYKGGKVTEPDFWKKILIWRYSRKGLQISPETAQIEVFGHILDFALLVFLDFAHNDRWA